MSTSSTEPGPADAASAGTRTTYRHGNLRAALLDAGVQLAREAGPGAVALREATRRAGVVPNAAYRHFQNHRALLSAVRAVAVSELAKSMEREWALTLAIPDQATRARAQLRAVGIGYLRFAQQETGLFRTAFQMVDTDPLDAQDPGPQGEHGLGPLGLLGAALDAMVLAQLLSPAQRPQAEYLAWSAVHGMALLITDGPLRQAPQVMRQALSDRLVRMVEEGLVGQAAA